MFQSIWRRIWVPYVLLILVTLLGLGAYLSGTLRAQHQEELNSKLAAEAGLIKEALAPHLGNSQDPQSINHLARHYAELILARVTIIDIRGAVLGDSHQDPATMEDHSSRPEVVEARAKGVGTSTRFSTTTGYQTFYYATSLRLEGTPVAIVRLAVPLSQIEASQSRLQATVIGVSLLASLVAILLAMWIAKGTTRPLRQLTQAAYAAADFEVQGSELQERIPSATVDEVGRLANAFNLLSQKLKSNHAAIRSEQDKVHAILQIMNDAVLVVDELGTVEMINPAAERVFSVRGEAVTGHSLAEVLRHHQIIALWQRSLEAGETERALIEVSTERLFLQAVAKPLGEVRPGSTILLFSNLTRQRFLETVRRDFVSNLSHELRTPLASLKALTETLQSGALEDPPAARRFLERMETEVDALTQMVAELLELARIESGRVPLQMTATRPADVITSAVDRLRLQAERARLNLTVDSPESLPAIQADITRLEQVLVNLLHNAIKFTPPGGTIHISANVEDGEDGEPVTVVFSVSDTGVGIAADDLTRIFERFYKADRARSSGGTGLGLAIARHIVEAHNGRIWAESVEGKGSTFYFSIPVVRPYS